MNECPFEIAGRKIGPERPPFVVAEMSANHGQDFQRAVAVLEAAADAGADAIKLQTYTAETLTLDCDRPCFRIQGTPWDQQLLHDLYSEAAMPWDWQPKLKARAEQLGLICFSTPFDPTSVDFLEEMDVPAYKIASFELVDLPLLCRVAATGKPVILSTGMATLQEIEEAVGTLREAGCRQLALLKCTSAYPATAESMNLRAIPHLHETFGTPVGLSDHSLDPVIPVAAVAIGACIIEKHFTDSRVPGGPDSQFSLEPHEFKQMVASIRTAHAALGQVSYGADDVETAGRNFRRSLFAVKDIAAGEQFTSENVRSIRPADGLSTRHLETFLGRLARLDIPRGTPMDWELIE